MKPRILLVILSLLLISNFIQAQDFDIYPRLKDDNIKMPTLYENTLFDEYQLLSRDIRMMDMIYSAIVPGYIHFKAKDYNTGYWVLGARVAGYAGLAYDIIQIKDIENQLKDLRNLDIQLKTKNVILYTSLGLIVSSYLFDWIHGKYRLEKKQENIRYKYSIKLQMNNIAGNYQQVSPGLSLTYNF